MRKLLCSVAATFAISPIALANETSSTITPTAGMTQTVRLNRYVFSATGDDPDVRSICGGAPAQNVEIKRSVADATLAVFSLAMYTPVHVTVTCGEAVPNR